MKFAVWMTICLVVALLGRDRRLGIWGTFLCGLVLGPLCAFGVLLTTRHMSWNALFASPVVVLVILLATQPRLDRAARSG